MAFHIVSRAAGAAAAVMVCTLCSCEVAPLQATGLAEHRVQAPRELPDIPVADPRAAEVPAGYRVEVVVRDLTYPSSVEFDNAGNMYVAESGYVYGDAAAPARILAITPDGEIRVVAAQLNGPITDLLWHDGQLYVSHRTKISAITREGSFRDLVTDLPSLGDHFNNQLTAGPDGRIYFGQGTATNSGVVGVDNFVFGWLGRHPEVHDVPAYDLETVSTDFVTLNPFVLTAREPAMVRTRPFAPFGTGAQNEAPMRGRTKSNGTILRMNPDGSQLEVYAWGLRNPFGVAWSPDGQLYASDNGYDDRGSRPVGNAPDVIWRVRQGAWYGWPDYVAGRPITDSRYRVEGKPQPEFVLREHPPVEQPWMTRPPHSALAKIEFERDGRFANRGHIFIAEVGDMLPITGSHEGAVGFQVLQINPQSRTVRPFFRARRAGLGPRHMEYAVTAGPRRPVDVRISPDGQAMYVADIGAIAVLPTISPTVQPFPGTGVIWRITREDHPGPSGPPANLSVAPERIALRSP